MRDSIITHTEGVQKVVHPAETCRRVLKQLGNTPVLDYYLQVDRPSRIPQTLVVGTQLFRQVVGVASTNGKGHTEDQALASGLMELVERYSCMKYLADPDRSLRAKRDSLGGARVSFDDVFSCVYKAGAARCLTDEELNDAELSWYEGSTIEGDPVLVPMGFIRNVIEGTNGMAAGNTLEEAMLQGLCETIERHCLTLVESRRLRTPLVDPATVQSTVAMGLLERYRELGQTVYIKDFSLGMGLPVLGVVRVLPEGHCQITAGVATGREEALTRALTENSQSEGGEEFRTLASAAHHLEAAGAVDYRDLPDVDDIHLRTEIENVAGLLEAQGMWPCFLETTQADLDVPALIVWVAGAKHKNNKTTVMTDAVGVVHDALAADRRDEAERYLDLGQARDETNAGILRTHRGLLLLRQQRYSDASDAFTGALAADQSGWPRDQRRYIQALGNACLGVCRQAMDDPDGAVLAYTRCVDVNSQFSFDYLWTSLSGQQALFDRSRALFEVARDVRLLRRSVNEIEIPRLVRECERDASAVAGHLAESDRLNAEEDYDGALQEALASVELNALAAELRNVRSRLGRLYARLGRPERAVDELKAAIAMFPREASLRLLMAHCLEELGGHEEARAELEAGMARLAHRGLPV